MLATVQCKKLNWTAALLLSSFFFMVRLWGCITVLGLKLTFCHELTSIYRHFTFSTTVHYQKLLFIYCISREEQPHCEGDYPVESWENADSALSKGVETKTEHESLTLGNEACKLCDFKEIITEMWALALWAVLFSSARNLILKAQSIVHM